MLPEADEDCLMPDRSMELPFRLLLASCMAQLLPASFVSLEQPAELKYTVSSPARLNNQCGLLQLYWVSFPLSHAQHRIVFQAPQWAVSLLPQYAMRDL